MVGNKIRTNKLLKKKSFVNEKKTTEKKQDSTDNPVTKSMLCKYY